MNACMNGEYDLKFLSATVVVQIRAFPSRVYKYYRINIEINKNHEVPCQFFNPSKWISYLQVLSYPLSEFNYFSTKIPQLSL